MEVFVCLSFPEKKKQQNIQVMPSIQYQKVSALLLYMVTRTNVVNSIDASRN